MSANFVPVDYDTLLMLPPDLRQWLSEAAVQSAETRAKGTAIGLMVDAAGEKPGWNGTW
jgi:hypothetical protein